MLARLDETICALASPPGAALRAVVRLAGPEMAACLARCLAPGEAAKALLAGQTRGLKHSRVALARLWLAAWERPLDVVLYLWPDRRSYTAQPTAELHLPGSPPLVEAVLAELVAAGARPALPGEFTLRAFLAGRIDLTQAEAVLGVIDARGEAELQNALAQLAGGLARPLATLRENLLDLLAELEAGLDFADEDLELITSAELTAALGRARRQLAATLGRLSERAAPLGEPRVVLAGLPNVGKSRLFNRLVGREPAIVSPLAGTTRDYLEGRWTWPGGGCLLIDTAGHEPDVAGDSTAGAARHQAAMAAQGAQLRLLCLDRSRPLTHWELRELDRVGRTDSDEPPTLIVGTKADLPPGWQQDPVGVVVSAAAGQGLAELAARVAERLAAEPAPGEWVGATAARCRASLTGADEALVQAARLADERGGDELVAAELRAALVSLGEVTGAVVNDEVLDRVFSRFCIGK